MKERHFAVRHGCTITYDFNEGTILRRNSYPLFLLLNSISWYAGVFSKWNRRLCNCSTRPWYRMPFSSIWSVSSATQRKATLTDWRRSPGQQEGQWELIRPVHPTSFSELLSGSWQVFRRTLLTRSTALSSPVHQQGTAPVASIVWNPGQHAGWTVSYLWR